MDWFLVPSTRFRIDTELKMAKSIVEQFLKPKIAGFQEEEKRIKGVKAIYSQNGVDGRRKRLEIN